MLKKGGSSNQYDWCPYKKKKWNFGHNTNIPAWRMLCRHEDRDWGDVFTSQGMTKIASKPDIEQICFHSFRGRQSSQHLDFRLPASRTVRQQISVA